MSANWSNLWAKATSIAIRAGRDAVPPTVGPAVKRG